MHCEDIVARMRNLAEDEKYLSRVAAEKNILFRPEVLKLRNRNGHRTDRYRMHGGPVIPEANGQAIIKLSLGMAVPQKLARR